MSPLPARLAEDRRSGDRLDPAQPEGQPLLERQGLGGRQLSVHGPERPPHRSGALRRPDEGHARRGAAAHAARGLAEPHRRFLAGHPPARPAHRRPDPDHLQLRRVREGRPHAPHGMARPQRMEPAPGRAAGRHLGGGEGRDPLRQDPPRREERRSGGRGQRRSPAGPRPGLLDDRTGREVPALGLPSRRLLPPAARRAPSLPRLHRAAPA